MASPGFTHVFAALLAVINSKLPEVGDLLIRRVILQFRRAYKRPGKSKKKSCLVLLDIIQMTYEVSLLLLLLLINNIYI